VKDEVEICWRFYFENCTMARHHETLRTALTTIVIALAAAAIGLLKPDTTSSVRLALISLVIGFGLFGAIVSRKHHQKLSEHLQRASAYRAHIDTLLPDARLVEIKNKVEASEKLKFTHISKYSLGTLWTLVNVGVVVAGILLGLAPFIFLVR
jgi:hypothetical protein